VILHQEYLLHLRFRLSFHLRQIPTKKTALCPLVTPATFRMTGYFKSASSKVKSRFQNS
jgi:hypothetical protein